MKFVSIWVVMLISLGAQANHLEGRFSVSRMDHQCSGESSGDMSPLEWPCQEVGSNTRYIAPQSTFSVSTLDDGGIRLIFQSQFETGPFVCDFSASQIKWKNGTATIVSKERYHGCEYGFCGGRNKKTIEISMDSTGLHVDYIEKTRTRVLGVYPLRLKTRSQCVFAPAEG